MRVEELPVVMGINVERHAAANLPIEIDQMQIDVVQQCVLWLQSERNCQTSTERLDVTTMLVSLPDEGDLWQQPTLAAGPLQWRVECA